MLNNILRKSRTPEEAAKALKQVEEQFCGSDSKGAYFIEKGFDVLSEPLKEDTTVYRYIYMMLTGKSVIRFLKKAFCQQLLTIEMIHILKF